MTAIVRYVDTASSGGDGTTQGHSGSTAAYASMQAAETAQQQNLLTGGHTMTILCAGSTDDTTNCIITGWTTSSSNTITFGGDPTAPDGDGINLTSAYNSAYYTKSVTSSSPGINESEEFVIIQDMQFESTSTTVDNACILAPAMGTPTGITVRRCRFELRGGTTTGLKGVHVNDADINITIENCTFQNFGTGTFIRAIHVVTCTSVTVTNCTINGGGTANAGILSNTAGNVTYIRNCMVFNCTDDLNVAGSTETIEYSAGDDAEFDSGTGNIGMNDTSGAWNAAVTDYTNGDFTVKDASSILYNSGTNTGAPATDIIGTIRPQATTANIGAFELIASAGGGKAGVHSWLIG